MTSENENLSLWRSVEKTDPQFTKGYKGPGGFTGTAVNAQYLAKRATEQFGRCGEGWGYDVLEERIDQGAPLIRKDGTEYGVNAQIHTLKLAFWYIGNDGEKKIVTHYGHTPFVSANSFGPSTDFEASKKSLTDAIGKCLSMLGFSADIRMGLYELPDYLEELKEEVTIAKAEDREAAEEARKAERMEWLKVKVKAIEEAPTLNAATKFHAGAARDAARRNETAFTRRLQEALETAKERFASTDAQEGAAQ